MKDHPKLDDVARIAGVSTATVSRCLNTPEKVGKKTKQKLLKIIEEIGYTPNFGGRVLASNRSNTVGVVIPTMENAIFARGIQAFQETISEAGITILVASSNYNPEQEYEQIKTLVGQGADALFLIGIDRPDKTYNFLKNRKIPFVLTWNYRPGSDYLIVGFNNKEAAKVIAERVISLGHRRLGMITAPTDGNDRAFDRVEGVKLAMKNAGLDETNLLLKVTNYSLEAGADAFQQLMSADIKPGVVICGNDVLAVGAIQRAHRLKMHIPEDVSITGFDDIDISEIVSPNLTTVHVPHRRMGQSAAEQLLKAMNGVETIPNINLEFQLVVRKSLGPPADEK